MDNYKRQYSKTFIQVVLANRNYACDIISTSAAAIWFQFYKVLQYI